jgi:DNA invertase Pin-like site-specific DNA recombinase
MSVTVNKSEFVRNNIKLSTSDIIAKAAEAGIEIGASLIYGLRSKMNKVKLEASGATPVVKSGKKAKKKVAKIKAASTPVVKPGKKAKKKVAKIKSRRVVQAPVSLSNSNGKAHGSSPVAIVFFDTAALVNSMKENFPQLSQGR